MKNVSFEDSKNLKSIEDNHNKIQEDIKNLPKEQQDTVLEVTKIFNEVNNDVFDFESEVRVRKAGYTPQQAEDIAFKIKDENIKVGQLFKYTNEMLVLTPFKTVVKAQAYVSTLQDRVLELTTIPVEIEVAQLKKTVTAFTSLSFIGLMKLAFKRLFKRG